MPRRQHPIQLGADKVGDLGGIASPLVFGLVPIGIESVARFA